MRPADLLRADSIRAHPVWAAVVAGALLGMLIGALRSVEIGDARPAPAPAWRLPAPESLGRGDERRLAQVRQADIWGASGLAAPRRGGSDAAAPESWRLLGIVLRPERLALVSSEAGGEVARIGVGQALPDGGRLLEIGDTLIRFERQGCRYQRRLFAPAAEPESGGCGEPATPPNDAPDPDR